MSVDESSPGRLTGTEASSVPSGPRYADALGRRAKQLPCVLVDPSGTVLRTDGAARSWFPDAIGRPLHDWFQDDADLRRCVASDMLGLEELRPTLADGRRVSLNAVRCKEGWAVFVMDVTPRQLLSESLVHRDRLDAVGGLSSAIARELNDPMSIVQGRLELMLELVGVVDAATTERHLRVALDHARRISATLRNLRLVGHRATTRLEPVRLSDVIDDARDLLGPRSARVEIDIEPADLSVGGQAPLYARVLANTLRQTIEGTARGIVFLVARRRGTHVRVQIHVGRTGRGEPTDWPELSIESTLLRSLGGALQGQRVQGAPTFELTFPLPPATRTRARPVDQTMLVVGEHGLAEDIAELLGKDGFAFDHVRTAAEALRRDPPDVALCDLLLPDGTSGWGLGRRLLARHPALEGQVLVLTDGPIASFPEAMVPVPKPLSRAGLLDALGRRVRRGSPAGSP